MAYLSKQSLESMNLTFGEEVNISDKCSIYGAENIVLGDNIRIDDFCILSAVGGKITLHNHIHLAAYSSFFGGGEIEIKDFCGVSSYSCIYSVNEDYSGNSLVGPTMLEKYRTVERKKVLLNRYVTIGTHSVVFPGTTLGEGAILGACSLASNDLAPWEIYSGVPARFIKKRNKRLESKAAEMEQEWKSRFKSQDEPN